MMSVGSSKTPKSTISVVGSVENKWIPTYFLDVGFVMEMSCFKFQVSRMSGMSSKTPLSIIFGVGSLEDRLYLS